MKQTINLRLIAISIFAVFLTVISLTFVYYELFKEQVKRDLRTEARIISAAGIDNLIENDSIAEEKDIRITLISNNGDVIFDNDVNNLDNHLDRPEVKDAFSKGIGESVRKSDTLNLRNFYYAVLLNNGTVLRVSTEARSIGSVFVSAFGVISMIVFVIVVLCIIISRLLTNAIIEPISVLAENIDNAGYIETYKEMDPFVKRIREQHKEILKSAKIRQDFTANVSHELKTPITAISGYAELIENEMVSYEQQIKFAGEIRKQSNRLVSLVNDIIRLSELDHKESVPEFSKIDVYEIAKERVELLKNNAREKNITLSLKGEHFMTLSNKGLVIELLDNLIQNAIRYNVLNGKVEVLIFKVNNCCEISVKDTGIGIPLKDQDRVFERFYRVDKSRSRETGGTGLGLAIVKHIVDLHDGEISLISEVSKGTTVTLRI